MTGSSRPLRRPCASTRAPRRGPRAGIPPCPPREATPRGWGCPGRRARRPGAGGSPSWWGGRWVIGWARRPDVVGGSLNPGARVGTVSGGAGPGLAPPRRWIGGMAYSEGSVHVNRDAEVSLRTGSTLFLSGVKRVDGEFAAGSVVELVDVRHPERLIRRGSVGLAASNLRVLRAPVPA